MKKLILLTLTTCILLSGCSTFKVVVTICDAEDAAMEEWSDAHNKGLTTDAFDKKVISAHHKFTESCLVAKSALQAYKMKSAEGSYIASLSAVKAAAQGVLDLVILVTSKEQGSHLQTMLNAAPTIGTSK